MILKILFIIMIITAVFMYLVILGASKCKTELDRKLEDEEQSKAINEAQQIIKENKNLKKGKTSLKDLFFWYKNEK